MNKFLLSFSTLLNIKRIKMAGQDQNSNKQNGIIDKNDIDPTAEQTNEEIVTEEYVMLDSKLDELNSALDYLEQKNDDIHEKLKELLQSNIDIRQEIRTENKEQDGNN